MEEAIDEIIRQNPGKYNKEEILEKAKKMTEAGKPERDKEFLNFVTALALPSVRMLFYSMIDVANLDKSQRTKVEHMIEAISPNVDIGGVEFIYTEQDTQKRSTAYIILDACKVDYDFLTTFEPLKNNLPDPEKWKEVLKHISNVVLTVRTLYNQVSSSEQGQDILKEINPDYIKYTTLNVDVDNTTLYIEKEWPMRIGVYLKLKTPDLQVENELPKELVENVYTEEDVTLKTE